MSIEYLTNIQIKSSRYIIRKGRPHGAVKVNKTCNYERNTCVVPLPLYKFLFLYLLHLIQHLASTGSENANAFNQQDISLAKPPTHMALQTIDDRTRRLLLPYVL